MSPRSRMSSPGQPKLWSKPFTSLFADSSFPDTKTLCRPGTSEGSTMTSQFMVLRVLTTLASGNALWICSARLSFVVTRSEGGRPCEKSRVFATSTSALPVRFSAPAARSTSSEASPEVQLKTSLPNAAAFGKLVFNCTSGDASLDVLRAAGAENLTGKALVDVANTLDFSQGRPPSLLVTTKESLAEQIQSAFPEARVVKTLNTMNCEVMVDPSLVPGRHNVFVSGNDESAKSEVKGLLQSFGWPGEDILDLGDITTARGPELYIPLWLRLYGTVGSGPCNLAL